MADEAEQQQLGPFPMVDEVLTKLKSNGTFDQFRKECLASVEAEVKLKGCGAFWYFNTLPLAAFF